MAATPTTTDGKLNSESAPPPPPPRTSLDESTHAELVFSTDTKAFKRMRDALCVVVGVDAAHPHLLAKLHLAPDPLPKKPPLCPTMLHAFKRAGRRLPKKWKVRNHCCEAISCCAWSAHTNLTFYILVQCCKHF
jgi:hypothetical protein